MRKLLLVIPIIAVSFVARAQSIRALTMDEIIASASSADTVYVVNFWATWCAPCVAELPEFDALQSDYAGKPVKILMVSLDFKEDYPKLGRFLEKKKLTPEVVWLRDSNPNDYIPKVDNSWQGSIPATVIVAPGKRYKKFIEGSITERQIRGIVDRVLNSK